MFQSYPGPTAWLLLLRSAMNRNASEFLKKDTLRFQIIGEREREIADLCVDGFIVLLNIMRFASDDESYSVFIPLLVDNLLETDNVSAENIFK